MARCTCTGGQCNCLIIPGEGQQISGSGHPNDPYVISNTGIRGVLRVDDTQTLDLSLFGSGTPSDPYLIYGDARVRLLNDMLDMRSGEVANPGDTIVAQGDGTWTLAPPPVAPAGAVNTGSGLEGDGTFVNPIVVAYSGVWGQPPLDTYGPDSTIGTPVYVDSNGRLRAAPAQVQTLTWDAITDKPTVFPTTWANVAGRPSSFPTSWNDVSGRPATFPTTWGQIAGRPTISSAAPSGGADGDIWFRYT